jgi:hypothetical protein
MSKVFFEILKLVFFKWTFAIVRGRGTRGGHFLKEGEGVRIFGKFL